MHTGAVSLIQRFGSALNPNTHFRFLFLDGVYVEHEGNTALFRWILELTDNEPTKHIHTIAPRLTRYLECQRSLK